MSEFDHLGFAEVEVAPVAVAAQVRGQSASDPASIGPAMERTFAKLGAFLEAHSAIPAGPPRAIYTSYGPEGTQFIVAVPLSEAPGESGESEEVFVDSLDGGKALRFTHRGPYGELMGTYGQITAFMQSKGLMESEADWARYTPMWEEYVNDPRTTAEAELVTHIYLPVK
jgi:effector-binding domain-containing protein